MLLLVLLYLVLCHLCDDSKSRFMRFLLLLRKPSLIIVILCVLPFSNMTGKGERFTTFNDISASFGMQAPFIKGNRVPYSSGFVFKVSGSNFYTPHLGFRGGLNYEKHVLADGNAALSVPFYFAYRSDIYRGVTVSAWTDTFGSFLFQVITGLIPRSFELNFGLRPGYIFPGVDSDRSYLIDSYYPHSYLIDKRFQTMLDAGLRINMKIWHFSLVLNPIVAYSLTKNYSFHTENSMDANQGLSPQWFFNGTIGLSFNF